MLDERHEYGARRMKQKLTHMGHPIERKRIKNLMDQQQLIAKARRKFKITTRASKRPYYVAENLLKQNFYTSAPNQAWVSDITLTWTQKSNHWIDRK